MKKLMVMLAAMLASVSILCACGAQPQNEQAVEEPVVSEEVSADEETETSDEEATEESDEEQTEEVSDEEVSDETADDAEVDGADNEKLEVVGEGEVQFVFEIVDAEGSVTKMAVNTDKKTVGEALVDNGLVEGEDSEYGLYVKTVNGITADYDVDQTYWAFYIDGEYAMTGVDQTDIEAGSTYSFKVEK